MAKMRKATIKKAHRIARAIMRKGGGARNPWAVGSARAQKSAAKRRRRRRR